MTFIQLVFEHPIFSIIVLYIIFVGLTDIVANLPRPRAIRIKNVPVVQSPERPGT